MDVLVFGAIIIVIIVVCKIIESSLRKPLIDRITEKYVFITGCDSGFGNVLVKQLDSKGVHVIAACLTQKGCTEVNNGTSDRVTTVVMDVTDHGSIINAYESVKKIIPNETALWGVVNNAGVVKIRGFLEWCRREDFEKTSSVNLFGAIDVSITFLPLLKKSGGRLVQVTSVAGRVAIGSVVGGYNESKFGLEAFTDNARREFIRMGYPIKVSLIEPGFFTTPLTNPDVFTDNMTATWERLSEEEKQQFPQDAAAKRAESINKAVKSIATTDITKVTDAMEHALLARWPKTRYTLGLDARLVWIPISYLPTSISDSILARL